MQLAGWSTCLSASLALVPLAACGFHHGGGEPKVLIGSAQATYVPDAPVEKLSIDVRSGRIEVRPADGAGFDVSVDVEVVESRQREFPEGVAFADHVRIRQDGAGLVVEDAHLGAPDGDDWELELVVLAPGSLELDCDIGAGQITVDLARTRDVDFDCGAGEIVFRAGAVDGGVGVDVGAGRCELQLTATAPTGDVNVDLGAGEIVVALPAELSAEIDASTAAGDISIDERFGVAVERFLMTADAEGVVGDGGPKIDLDTATGAIRIR